MLLTINEMFVNRKLKKGGADNSVPRVGGKGVGICSSESIVNLGKSAILYQW